jgi:hypothetical protein
MARPRKGAIFKRYSKTKGNRFRFVTCVNYKMESKTFDSFEEADSYRIKRLEQIEDDLERNNYL